MRAISCRALALLALAAVVQPALADTLPPVPDITATHVTRAPHIDGRLTEAEWQQAVPATQFTQSDPHEGQPASERTEVRVLLGDDALYVGARLYDREPQKIRARLSRRDNSVSTDRFEVFLDGYHNHLTGAHFRVNPGGAIYDGLIGASGAEDASWDPVWDAAAHIDSLGWTAEMRIPFSQIRYTPHSGGDWGIQFARVIFRTGEIDWFSFTPKKETGGVARYGNLHGVGEVPATRRLEVRPYLLARDEALHDTKAGQLHPSAQSASAGFDAKYGLSSTLTLDATVNPDFGQVEVDPASVNLTTAETFYPEKRGFFVEGSDLFTFAQSRSMNSFGFLRAFHSRRIGRAPTRVVTDAIEADAPDETTILGAAKVTGRTKNGWAIGVLDALTARERATVVYEDDSRGRETVEPFSHYSVARVSRAMRNGNTVVGGILTSVQRSLPEQALADLYRSSAYLAGVDLNHAWKQQAWAVDASFVGTLISGSPSVIAAAQRSPLRYYNRADHESYAHYDPTRTSLSGYGWESSITKQGGTHWLGSMSFGGKSPGLEFNDLGFHTQADYKALSPIVMYTENTPHAVFRNYTIYPYTNWAWDYAGKSIYNAQAVGGNATLWNFWSVNGSYTNSERAYDNRLTRGGPATYLPHIHSWDLGLTTDSRKTWSLSPSVSHSANDLGGWGNSTSLTASFRPSPTLKFSFEPGYDESHSLFQYVRKVPDATAAYGTRYIVSALDQRTLSLVTRMDATFTPRLSVQLYVQPLVSTGAYSEFKDLYDPGHLAYALLGRDRGSVTAVDGGHLVDPGTGTAFFQPDFNFRSLLGNAVVRWEYRPGSTLYFVWQQSRQGVAGTGDFSFHRDFGALVDQPADNVFVVKATYWLGV